MTDVETGSVSSWKSFNDACNRFWSAMNDNRFNEAGTICREAWDMAGIMQENGAVGYMQLQVAQDELETMNAVVSIAGKTLEQLQEKYRHF